MHARGAVEEDLIVQQDASFIGAHESGDGIERQSLAGAARTKQHRHSGGGAELQIQRKTGGIRPGRVLLANPRLDHNAVWRGPKGLEVRRFASVRMASATAETMITSTRAVAPLPRFHGVVDRDGDGLGAARNVAGDHQRDAEIAQRSGKGERGWPPESTAAPAAA